jgi:hypothetical protein
VLAALRAAGNTHTRIVTLDLSEPIALDMVQGGNVAAIVADQAPVEEAAARRLFGLLPEPTGSELLALWLEFEAAPENPADAYFGRVLSYGCDAFGSKSSLSLAVS